MSNIDNKKTMIFDFDGVIHKDYKGYRDGSIYGDIDLELLDYIIDKLLNKYYIAISSNRPAEQIVEHMNNLNYRGMKFELKNDKDLFWNKDNIIGVSNKKIAGIIYIDDRGYRYTDLEEFKNNIDKLM